MSGEMCEHVGLECPLAGCFCECWRCEAIRRDEEADQRGERAAACNCTCQIAGAHDPDCAIWGPPQEPPGALSPAVAAERERLFVAIRHALPLDAPWRGDALDLIAEVWRGDGAQTVGRPDCAGILEAVRRLTDGWLAGEPHTSALEEDRAWVRGECAKQVREVIAPALPGAQGGGR